MTFGTAAFHSASVNRSCGSVISTMLPDFLERPPEPPSPLLGKGAMHTYPRDAEGLRDGRGAMSNRPHLTHPLDRDGRFAAFKIPLAFPASIPACCRSRMNLRSISAPIPSTAKGLHRAKRCVHNSGMKIGYARVSTEDQTLALQLDALRVMGCEVIHEDQGVSGTAAKRPG